MKQQGLIIAWLVFAAPVAAHAQGATARAKPPGRPAAEVGTVVSQPRTAIRSADQFRGTLVPVMGTITFPPGGGVAETLQTRNLELAADGYYYSTADGQKEVNFVYRTSFGLQGERDNWFVMNIPAAPPADPLVVGCLIKGQPRFSGHISWSYGASSGPLPKADGGNSGIWPPEGASQFDYTISGAAAVITQVIVHALTANSGIRSCTVTGQFLRPAK
ncbi:MAG: hypothetical protein JO127_00755 [Caulobacteraceae bacterium]|nr:hypothetical protein [Caulobacteraceae bacterium]